MKGNKTMWKLRAILAGVSALALMAPGARAATNFVGPIQTYGCASHTWANSLASATGATTCTQPFFTDISGQATLAQLPNIGGGTVLGNATGSTAAPSALTSPILGLAGTATGTLGLSGTTSGTITIQPQGAAGTYNFNLPTTVGSAGQVLTSQGGGATAMTWSTVASNAFTVTNNPASPVTLATANDGTRYQITNSTNVTFNLTGSLAAGDNWCFDTTSTGNITVADNSISNASITMANVVGTLTTGTLVSVAAGSTACLFITAGGAAPTAMVYASEGAWTLN